jgi:succinate dehydrogenase / fumarate reductase cytochrome b subunit
MFLPSSSIAKKAWMAITGLMLCAFLCLHLLGNIVLLLNDDMSITLSPGGPHSGAAFQWVAEHYEAFPLLFHAGEIVLLGLFAAHALMGATLWFQNMSARGRRYVAQRWEGGRTPFSSTMPWTGIAFIAVFLVLHVVNFRFGPQESPAELYTLVGATFGTWYWALVYVVALAGLGFHLAHGFQSAFQSLGFNHPRYTPWIRRLGYLFAAAMFAGFAVLPVLFFLNGGM